MKRLLLLLMVFCQLLAAPLGAGAEAKVPPRPTASIYVQDQAGVLSQSTKATINAYSTALQKKTKAQIVVLTVPTLKGQSLEDYSLTVLRQWGIGDKEKKRGPAAGGGTGSEKPDRSGVWPGRGFARRTHWADPGSGRAALFPQQRLR